MECGAVLEAETVVSGFEGVAVVGQAVEQCRRHFGVTEHARPFREAEVGRDDDAGPLVEPAQQMVRLTYAQDLHPRIIEQIEGSQFFRNRNLPKATADDGRLQ